MAVQLRCKLWLLQLTLIASSWLWGARTLSAQATDDWITHVELSGLSRTRAQTVLELLPHALPARLSDAQLRELSRRLDNLAIFDHVEVRRAHHGKLRVEAREKWTLVPNFDLARGSTLADTYVLLGVTEYNLFGRGAALDLSIYRERRGFGFHLGYQEHVYRRDRWSLGAELSYETAELRFDADGWLSRTGLVYLWATSTPLLFEALRYEVGAYYRRELIDDAQGPTRPPDGHSAGGSMLFTWDAYRWDDLVPQGFSVGLNLSPGFFFGARIPEARHRVELTLKAAAALGPTTSLAARVMSGVTTRGNANHNLLPGSVQGVRGLEDGLHFSWLMGFVNLELRHALRFAERWAVQGVVFSDAAAFEQLTGAGARGQSAVAFSCGVGVRVIPTWLSGLLLRFDVARLFVPEASYFYQYGLSQYF